MEGQNRKPPSLRRTARKPLADRTNTLSTATATATTTRRKPPSSPALKPPSSAVTATTPPPTTTTTTTGSAKSITSTGSNASPSVPSLPHDGRDRRKMDPPAVQSQRQDAKTSKDKGNIVLEAPVVQNISSSVDPGALSNPPVVQSQKSDAQIRKDKGKMVLESLDVEAPEPLTPQAHLLIASSSASDGRDRWKTGPSEAQSQRQDSDTRKDKEKMVLETPVFLATKPFTPRTLQISSSATSDNLSRPPAVQSQNSDSQTRKDKGKMVIENVNTEAHEPMTPNAPLVNASSYVSGTRDQERHDFLTVYKQRLRPRRRNHADGKIVLPLSCPPGKRVKRKGVKLDDGSNKRSGAHTDPLPLRKKKRSRKKDDDDDTMHEMPQDEIERLRTYFKEIDAFELPEEVASESDSD